MKRKITMLVFASMLVFTACQKNEIPDNTQKVDAASYVAQLSQDYSQASLYHSATTTTSTDTSTTRGTTTTTTGGDGTGHASHHIIGLKKVSSVDSNYNELMFATNDSLFSEHYFKYCIDMLKSDIMVVDSTGLMGQYTTSMSTGSMGNMIDKNTMLLHMDSIHLTIKNSTNRDYMLNDSIMHNHMIMCKTMSIQADSVENLYSKMYILRKNHKLKH